MHQSVCEIWRRSVVKWKSLSTNNNTKYKNKKKNKKKKNNNNNNNDVCSAWDPFPGLKGVRPSKLATYCKYNFHSYNLRTYVKRVGKKPADEFKINRLADGASIMLRLWTMQLRNSWTRRGTSSTRRCQCIFPGHERIYFAVRAK